MRRAHTYLSVTSRRRLLLKLFNSGLVDECGPGLQLLIPVELQEVGPLAGRRARLAALLLFDLVAPRLRFREHFLRGLRRASRGGRGRRRGLGRLPDVLQDVVVEHEVVVGVDGAGEGVLHGCDGAACAQRNQRLRLPAQKLRQEITIAILACDKIAINFLTLESTIELRRPARDSH